MLLHPAPHPPFRVVSSRRGENNKAAATAPVPLAPPRRLSVSRVSEARLKLDKVVNFGERESAAKLQSFNHYLFGSLLKGVLLFFCAKLLSVHAVSRPANLLHLDYVWRETQSLTLSRLQQYGKAAI